LISSSSFQTSCPISKTLIKSSLHKTLVMSVYLLPVISRVIFLSSSMLLRTPNQSPLGLSLYQPALSFYHVYSSPTCLFFTNELSLSPFLSQQQPKFLFVANISKYNHLSSSLRFGPSPDQPNTPLLCSPIIWLPLSLSFTWRCCPFALCGHMHTCNIDTPFSPPSLHHTQQMNINSLVAILSSCCCPIRILSPIQKNIYMCAPLIYSFNCMHITVISFSFPSLYGASSICSHAKVLAQHNSSILYFP